MAGLVALTVLALRDAQMGGDAQQHMEGERAVQGATL